MYAKKLIQVYKKITVLDENGLSKNGPCAVVLFEDVHEKLLPTA